MNARLSPDGSFPKPSRRLRLGIVGGGTGLVGPAHVNGARLSGRWELVAGVLSPDPERAKAAGAEWLIDPERNYRDFREMALVESRRPDGIDAVAIATPAHMHASVAEAFLAEEIDVICDKPLATTLAEAEALVGLHAGTDCVFGVAYAYASHAMIRQAREMVLAGDIGTLRQVHVEYFQDWAIDVTDAGPNRPSWLDPDKGGGSLTVADIGTHAAHIVEFVSGSTIRELRAEFHVLGASKALEDTAYMTLRLVDGAVGTLMVSQATAGSQCGLRLRLSGTKATLDWEQETPDTLHLRPIRAPRRILTRGYGAGMKPAIGRLIRAPRGHPEAISDAWANLYLEFAVAVAARLDGRVLPMGLIQLPTIADGLRGTRFIEAAIKSNETGTPVLI